MTTVRITQGQNVVYNEAGLQVIGTTAPNRSGLNPKELLEAALGLCVSISMQKKLARDGVDYDASEIEIEIAASKAQGVTDRFTDFKVTLKLPDSLDEAYKHELIEAAEEVCTIGNTLRNGAAIETVEV
ncbi:OsmC family protein [Cohnella sp. LGH]|uniref:Putative OsmC-like protein n=1 Tax=Cohnella phaseoli TaxID=456490 RepID=A0A3D9HZT6_9BACL|nr:MULTISPECIES: OsmC family protein [Cohnella]QTH40436.1 OsmC family protein [Cohnella sp. LGH]RED55032.1 putative OsmC-like protein [Cohnella phaseoli]